MIACEGREYKMEIERINENTIKFFISYLDIEKRGFEREEIWNDRERSEQLFWKMMEEVNYKEDFVVEGPLWIQVHALEKGLEVVVTKSQISKDGENIKLPLGDDSSIELPVDEKIESLLENRFGPKAKETVDENKKQNDEKLSVVVKFNSFEDIIQLSHYFIGSMEGTAEILYHYKDDYYYRVEFSQEILNDYEQENMISKILEFAIDADVSLPLLEVYGKEIFTENVLEQIKAYFPNK